MEVILKNLKTAIFDVMERMYFLLADEIDFGAPDIAKGQTVYIGITGNPRYLVTIIIDGTLASTMASDILGIEDGIDDDTIQKCLKETANIIAGNFLLGFNSSENRNVTLPHMKKADVFGGIHSSDLQEINVSFNGHGVTAVIETIDTL